VVHVPNPRPPYSPEFRAEAVRLYRSSGRGLKRISEELGIAHESLRRWDRQDAIDTGHAPGLSTDEREELHRLRRENRVLREERDILKKAAAFFAREEQRSRQ
jgi:transposase